jgi:death on curing protein
VTLYLTVDDLLFIAEQLLERPPQVRDVGLLASAAARPATVAFGVEAYGDVWTKAAALLQSVNGNHSIIDGNKRLAWTAARVFLTINEVPLIRVDVDQAEAFMLAVTAHELDSVEDIAAGLVRLYGTDGGTTTGRHPGADRRRRR